MALALARALALALARAVALSLALAIACARSTQGSGDFLAPSALIQETQTASGLPKGALRNESRTGKLAILRHPAAAGSMGHL